MGSPFVAASAAAPIPAPMPAPMPPITNKDCVSPSNPPRVRTAKMKVPSASPAPIAAPIPAPLPRPSFEGVVIVRMSDFGITARPARLRSSRADGDRCWNWPWIRSPFFSSAMMGDVISKVETFSQRPGITSACAGMKINTARIKETIWIRHDFIVGKSHRGTSFCLGLLPPMGHPHSGQEVRIRKCDFCLRRGSRRPGVATDSGGPNHLEGLGVFVSIAGAPSHHSESLCWGGTS